MRSARWIADGWRTLWMEQEVDGYGSMDHGCLIAWLDYRRYRTCSSIVVFSLLFIY